MSEDASLSPNEKGTRQRWPKEVRNGSVSVTVYRVWRKNLNRYVFNVAYYRGGTRQLDQRGQESVAMEHARFTADLLASGRTEAAEVQQRDLDELNEARRRAGSTPLLLALDEWTKARELAGAEIIRACEAWAQRLTKYERLSAAEVIAKFRGARGVRQKDGTSRLSKSYESVLKPFVAKFGERYFDDLRADEIDAFVAEPANDWTKGTRRKRVVTLFRWARRKGFLPRDMITEADRTETIEEPAPSRHLTEPETLARILFLLQFGHDLEHPSRAKFEPRPELVPAVVLSTMCGERSIEGHVQSWDDLDLDERQVNVTKAKEGTAADRPIELPHCAIEWLKLTSRGDRSGPVHPYKTEVHTILRNHLRRTIGLQLPKNTFRKSWVSYRLRIAKEGMASVSEEAGHSRGTEIKHYRNSRAKRSAAHAWFAITPQILTGWFAKLQARERVVSLRELLETAPVESMASRPAISREEEEQEEADSHE